MDSNIEEVASWFKSVINGENIEASKVWNVDKEEVYNNYPTRFCKFYTKDQEEKLIPLSKKRKNFDYNCEQIVMPNGKIITPIRQFCEFKTLPPGTKEAVFYSMSGVVYSGIDGELVSKPTIKHNVVNGVVSGTLINIGYSQVENSAIGLISSINISFALESVHNENTQIGNLFEIVKTAWVNGKGETIKDDSKINIPLSIDALLEAKRIIMKTGIDTKDLVFYTTQRGLRSLIDDRALDKYIAFSKPSIITQGVIEKITGIKIITSSGLAQSTEVIVKKKENLWQKIKRIWFRKEREFTSLPRGDRSFLFKPGVSFGLISGTKLTMEAQRRNEIQSISVTGTQRVAGVIKEPSTVVCISHK